MKMIFILLIVGSLLTTQAIASKFIIENRITTSGNGSSSNGTSDGTGGWTNNSVNTYTALQVLINNVVGINTTSVFPALSIDCGLAGGSDDCVRITSFGGFGSVFRITGTGNVWVGSPEARLITSALDNTFTGANTFSQALTLDTEIDLKIRNSIPSAPTSNYGTIYSYNNSGLLSLRYIISNGSVYDLIYDVPATGIILNTWYGTLANSTKINVTEQGANLTQIYDNSNYISYVTELHCINITKDINNFEISYNCYVEPQTYTSGTGQYMSAYLKWYNGSTWVEDTASRSYFMVANIANYRGILAGSILKPLTFTSTTPENYSCWKLYAVSSGANYMDKMINNVCSVKVIEVK